MVTVQNFEVQKCLKTKTLTSKDLVARTNLTVFREIEQINFVCNDEKWLEDSKFDENIIKLASYCTKLISLNLTGFEESKIGLFRPLLKISTSLTCDAIGIEGWEALNDSSIMELTVTSPWQELDNKQDIQSAKNALARLKLLEVRDEELGYCMTGLGYVDDEIVKNLTNIEELYLECGVGLDVIGKYCKHLKKLHMAYIGEYDEDDAIEDSGEGPEGFEEELRANWSILGQGCVYLEEFVLKDGACGCVPTKIPWISVLNFSYFRNLKFVSVEGVVVYQRQ